MSVSKLSDLLPIDPSVAKPNAYQVFGLNGGEQDAATVTAAMQRVYEGLKDSKATADPTVWKQAAKLAEAARKLLEDPERRCALDVTLGVSAVGSLHFGVPQPETKSPGSESAVPNGAVPNGAGANEHDPLAGLLPTSDPFSHAASGSASESVATSNASSVLGVPSMGTPASAASVLGTPSRAPRRHRCPDRPSVRRSLRGKPGKTRRSIGRHPSRKRSGERIVRDCFSSACSCW